MILDDEKYNSLRNSLKSLPKLKAKSGFETRLFQRIKEAEKNPVASQPVIVKEPRVKSWFANLFRPSFAPALGLTVVLLITVVVYFAYFSKMGDKNNENQVSSSDSKQEQGGFVIYVKKDPESSYSDNYPKEYSAVTIDETGKERLMSPTESPSDFLSRPEKDLDKLETVPDRISDEQKIEMKRSSDIESKGTDSKSDRKGDDIILKKESKSEPRKKGEMKSESEETPFNIRDEKKNENNNDGIINQQVEPPKSEDKVKDDDNTGIDNAQKKDSSKFGQTAKDSIKAKTKSIDLEKQEDSTEEKK